MLIQYKLRTIELPFMWKTANTSYTVLVIIFKIVQKSGLHRPKIEKIN